MATVGEISDFIRRKVSEFKAMPIECIDLNASLSKDIGLIGDDFSELDFLLCEKFNCKTDQARVIIDLSINKWAEIVANKSKSF
jgi:hypothetical protein